MNKMNAVLVHTFAVETGSGEGADVDLFPKGRGFGKTRFLLDVTEITGTDMAIDIVATLGGVDYVVGSFTDAAAISNQSLFLDCCPDNVKAVFTENAITTFSATIYAVSY